MQVSYQPELVDSAVFKNRTYNYRKKSFKNIVSKLTFLPILTIGILAIVSILLVIFTGVFLSNSPRVSRSLLPVCNNGFCYSLHLNKFQGNDASPGAGTLEGFMSQLQTLKEMHIETVILEPQRFLTFSEDVDPRVREVVFSVPVICRKLGIGLITEVLIGEGDYADYYISLGIQGFIFTVTSYIQAEASIETIMYWANKIHNAKYNVKGKMILRYTQVASVETKFIELMRTYNSYIDYVMYHVDIQNKSGAFVAGMPRSIWTSGNADPGISFKPYQYNKLMSEHQIIFSAFLGSVDIQSQQETFKQYHAHFSDIVANLTEEEKSTLKLFKHLIKLKEKFPHFEDLGLLHTIPLTNSSMRIKNPHTLYCRMMAKPSFYKAVCLVRNMMEPKTPLEFIFDKSFKKGNYQMLFSYPEMMETVMFQPTPVNITLQFGEAILFVETFA